MTSDPAEPLAFLRRRLPPGFDRRVVVVEPGRARIYDEAEWRDAIVVVEHGQIELECVGGSRQTFGPGDVLHLDGLPVRRLCSRGGEPAVLIAVRGRRRRGPVRRGGRRPS